MQTPRYVYSRKVISSTIDQVKQLSAPYGLIIRYAVKANPHPEIINMFNKAGLYFDCSSSYEVDDLLEQGVEGSRISLSSQQLAPNLEELLNEGITFTATSLHQLQSVAELSHHYNNIGIRMNPGIGSGHSNKVSTGGPAASFGIWYEYLDQALQIAIENDFKIDHLHIHIGSGTNPKVWSEVATKSLEFVKQMPDVKSLNMGGGFKTGYKENQADVDINAIIDVIGDDLRDFNNDNDRKIELEIEPGRFMIAHAGTLVANVEDIVNTGTDGYTFIKLNVGMNDFLRTALYGSYHKINILNDSGTKQEYVVVGHNCESSDLFTSHPDDSEMIEERLLNTAQIGDEVRIYDTGAYCASMRARGYNSFPDTPEILID